MIEIVIKAVLIIVVVVIVALLANKAEDYANKKHHEIPFKESMDLLNVPVVTFMNNGVKLHFLLDTGSDSSFIRKEILDGLHIEEQSDVGASIETGGGKVQSYGLVTMDIIYMDKSFKEEFEIADVPKIWDEYTKGCGVTVHGILGSRFFERYQYQIDFKRLVAYSKK